MKKKILSLIILLIGVFFFSSFEAKAKDDLTCLERNYPDTCKDRSYGYSCVWNETEFGNYCNTDKLLYVTCGDASDIPYQVPALISMLVNLLKIVAPIILIFTAIIALIKAIVSSKEDEMKKAQSSLVKKIMAAVLIFFITSIVQFVIIKVADIKEQTNLSDCLSCFLNNDCEENVYYKTTIAGTEYCTSLNQTSDVCEEFNITNFDEVNTEYYQGPKAESCNEQYFLNQNTGTSYQPKSIKINGKCYTLTDTNKDLINSTIDLSGNRNSVTQSIWKANGQCYYWEGKENEYKKIDCDTNLITPYYTGKKADDYGYGYFEGGYQPKSVYDFYVGSAYKLTNTGKKYIVNTEDKYGNKSTLAMSIYEANNKCYYWEGRDNSYKSITCDGTYSIYYQGSKAESCNGEYFTDTETKTEYQPKSINIDGQCYKLTDTGKKHAHDTKDLLGNSKILEHKVWTANNKCYYWNLTENKYIETGC